MRTRGALRGPLRAFLMGGIWLHASREVDGHRVAPAGSGDHLGLRLCGSLRRLLRGLRRGPRGTCSLLGKDVFLGAHSYFQSELCLPSPRGGLPLGGSADLGSPSGRQTGWFPGGVELLRELLRAGSSSAGCRGGRGVLRVLGAHPSSCCYCRVCGRAFGRGSFLRVHWGSAAPLHLVVVFRQVLFGAAGRPTLYPSGTSIPSTRFPLLAGSVEGACCVAAFVLGGLRAGLCGRSLSLWGASLPGGFLQDGGGGDRFRAVFVRGHFTMGVLCLWWSSRWSLRGLRGAGMSRSRAAVRGPGFRPGRGPRSRILVRVAVLVLFGDLFCWTRGFCRGL